MVETTTRTCAALCGVLRNEHWADEGAGRQARSRDPHRPARARPRPLRARRPRVGGAVRRHGRQGRARRWPTTSPGSGPRPSASPDGRSTRSTRCSSTHAVKTPIALVTGYLGSGKTTLIRALLEDPALGDTAVIVNELGEIGHRPRDPAARRRAHRPARVGLRVLHAPRRSRRRAPRPRRPPGDAARSRRSRGSSSRRPGSPTPRRSSRRSSRSRSSATSTCSTSVVATVDAQHGLRGEESERQVAAADVLVVTKADLADPAERRAVARRAEPGRVRRPRGAGRHRPRAPARRRGAARVDSSHALSRRRGRHGGHRTRRTSPP